MKLAHLPRYGDIAALLVKHRAAVDLERGDGARGDLPSEEERRDAEELASDLEAMGPTFVKFGQLLSTRSDVLSPAYLQALRRLQEEAQPVDFDDVRRVLEDELGTRIQRAFLTFDPQPRASASLGQVHHAQLRDGRDVAVKVQRPDIRELVLDDIDTLGELATLVDAHSETGRRFGFAAMVEEFRSSLLAELDYQAEARHQQLLGANLERFEGIVVPQPILDYTTARVLTMSWIPGRSLGSLSSFARSDLDGSDLAEQLFSAYLDQVLVDGLFHADPHPGNLLLTDDRRIALIDLGMVGRIPPDLRGELLKLLLAVSQGRGAVAADILSDLGDHLQDFDREVFKRRIGGVVSHNASRSVAELQMGTLLAEILQAAAVAGLRPPRELTMLGKTLLNLDESARILDPEFEPGTALERHLERLFRRRALQEAAPANVLSTAMEMVEFTERLPGRVNKVLDSLSEGKLTFKIEGIDERQLMRGVQKLANRVALGAVVAALVIAGAIALSVRGGVQVLGVPAAATILFALAALIALWLVGGILLSDLPQVRGGARRRRKSMLRRERSG